MAFRRRSCNSSPSGGRNAMSKIDLLRLDGSVEWYRVGEASPYPHNYTGELPRTVYAAAHVVANSVAMRNPWQSPEVDWDATLRFRHHLWGLGLKIDRKS